MLNSTASVYFDAYTGDQDYDKEIAMRNKTIEQITHVSQDGQRQKKIVTNE